jgi:glycosyltransferase involved in cell wall biosynthesis
LPAITVVLATADRAGLLRLALESLAAQTLPAEMFEVVVVDDGSTDDTRLIAEAFGSGLNAHYAYQRRSGIGSARNHGLFLASGDIVLFVDDDDVAAPTLLEEHLRAHSRHPDLADAVLGMTRLAPDAAPDPLMSYVTGAGGHLFSYDALTRGALLDFRYFWGGRTSCKRSFMLQHGVFDQGFRFGCEDVELAYRLSKHGLRVFYEPDAVTSMRRTISFDGFCERLHRQGKASYRFSRLHDDPAVQEWSGVVDAERHWPREAAHYDDVVLAARHADRLSRLKLESGLELSAVDLDWLHGAYRAAFRLAKMKGIMDARAETAPAEAGQVGNTGDRDDRLSAHAGRPGPGPDRSA